jgi:hypothetical protein
VSGVKEQEQGTTQPLTAALLAAGAVLEPGAKGAGERAVPMTVRAYRHPGLQDRVVMRLVPAELGAAEDAAAGYLGLTRAAKPAVVGLGLRRSLAFPEWILVHHPRDGRLALALGPDLERTAQVAKAKPKAAVEAYERLASQLATAVPHFLPTYFEQAGRVFLALENTVLASKMFMRARVAEAQYGLEIDEDRMEEACLEFALAGALPVKALTDYGKRLAAKLPASEALDRYMRLCMSRTAGGLAPLPAMTTGLRRLAKSAGELDGAAEERLLAELLKLPATMRATADWWMAHRGTLISLARREPAVRRPLLDFVPEHESGITAAMWLDLLIESGAADALHEPGTPDEQRPTDGTAGWFRRFEQLHRRGTSSALARLYPLVERCADRLRAELSPAGAKPLAVPAHDVDLLDLLLALGVPVADPTSKTRLELSEWSKRGSRRDLSSIAADARFTSAFANGADRIDRRTVDALAASAAGRVMLTQWARDVAQQIALAGLPEVRGAIERLSRLSGDAMALAEPEVRAAATGDLSAVLARTLRAGLFDELTWPAWEQAAAQLVAPEIIKDLRFADAWPYLIVAGPTQIRVIDADGTVLTHDLRVQNSPEQIGFHFVDSELFVYWKDGSRVCGYWHGSADQIRAIELPAAHSFRSTRIYDYNEEPHSSLPLPGGGRTAGRRVIHRGDSAVPQSGPLAGDGTSYWARGQYPHDRSWYEFDPVSGRLGRESMPAFFADALRAAPEGSIYHSGMLLPSGPDGGLLGFCVVKLPDGSKRLRTVDGLEVSVPKGVGHDPVGALVMPGDDRPRALVRSGYQVAIVDTDGIVTTNARVDEAAGTFGRTSAALPPLSFWHHMRPRDPRGSAALRRIDDTHAARLLKAGAEQRAADPKQSRLSEIVRELLPDVSDNALIGGICKVLSFAVEEQVRLDKVAARLDDALESARQPPAASASGPSEPVGPEDELLFEPMSVLGADKHYGLTGDGAFRQLRLIGEALQRPFEPGAAGEAPNGLHLNGPGLPQAAVEWWTPMLGACSALAISAVSPTTPPTTAAALRDVLRTYDAAGLAAPADVTPWRRVQLHVEKHLLTSTDGKFRQGSWIGMLPRDDSRLMAFVTNSGLHYDADGVEFTALYHDPSRRFDIPEPYTLRGTEPVGEQRETGWLATFLDEWDKRGPAPWIPEAADMFSELTGTTALEARLILAGLPGVWSDDSTLSTNARVLIKTTAREIAVAKRELRRIEPETFRGVLAALLPADPARLWTVGPDTAAAAEVWNRAIQERTCVPEALVAEASRAVRTSWSAPEALRALVAPARSPELSTDLKWKVIRDRVRPAGSEAAGFEADTLTGTVAMSVWLAHRLPVGDPVRAGLPAALDALRDRLSNPGLMLSLSGYANLPKFRKAAGAPTEVGEGYERYGAVIMATYDDLPLPAVSVAHLDATGDDPYLAVLRSDEQTRFFAGAALRLAHDPAFAALLDDPGDPAAGERAQDGTWYPQDPTRSVPDLVTEVARDRSLSADAAALYLMLLAMPDPTDRATLRWTGWRRARMVAARTELAATDLVVQAERSRTGRSLFLPGTWTLLGTPHLPLEAWKIAMYGGLLTDNAPVLGTVVPTEPAERLYRRAWQRLQDGDVPRFAVLEVGRPGTRRGRA